MNQKSNNGLQRRMHKVLYLSHQLGNGQSRVVTTHHLDFTSLYKWIAENASLFNDFTDTQAEVALVVSREATRKYVYRINSIVHALEEANVAFDILVAGDAYFKNPVSFNT